MVSILPSTMERYNFKRNHTVQIALRDGAKHRTAKQYSPRGCGQVGDGRYSC